MFERKISATSVLFVLGFALLLLTPFSVRADLVINELTGNNSTTVFDEDGDYEDWIELYNRGESAINLAGYGLTDDPEDPFQWVFSDWTLGPGEHLLVWTSGKDRRPAQGERLTGIWREVYRGLPSRIMSVLLDHAIYPDRPDSRNLVTDYFEAPRDIDDHYGTRMRGYIVPPETGEYVFWIASDDAGRLYLDPPGSTSVADYDDPIAYVPDDQWSSWRQWNKFSQQQSDPIFLEAGEKYLITALQKEHEGGDHLTVRWRLPDGTMEEPIPAHRILAEELRFHTNFSISKDGNAVQLTAPDGTVVDSVPPIRLPPDVSYGRSDDGGGEWVYFERSTPGRSNNDAVGYAGILDPPQFSHAGGFYPSPFALTLSTGDPDVEIYYTRDSSRPDPAHVGGDPDGQPRTSILYEGSLTIDTSEGPPLDENWHIEGDELVQTSLAQAIHLMFGDTEWEDYELTLQARKTGGNEGFLIFFRVDGDNYYQMNYGGWGNVDHGLEKGHGTGGHSVFQGMRTSGSVDTDVWYDIRIRAEGNTFECWLDDELIFAFTDDSSSPNMTGQVGVGTWQTQVRFRDIEVTSLGGETLFSGLPDLPREGSATNVVRARAFKEGYLPSATATETYIVDSNVANRYNMPVISIAAEQPDLFGYHGIYVPGWSNDVAGIPNFMMKGNAWERPAHVTFFEPDGEIGFSQEAGIRIHGGWTRNLPQKSLRLYARGSLYDESRFAHRVFPDAPYEEYNRLLLRNSGNDNAQTMFRDAMMQRLVKHLRMDTQAYRPSVVYLNGQYWGIHNIRERYDRHYLARTYGVNPDRVDILEFRPSSPHSVKEGSDDHYNQTIAYIEANGLSAAEHYEHIKTRIDIGNFIDYNVAQIFVNNSDWPNNNNDFWRFQAEEYDPFAPHGHDGRWRWLLFDTDFGFGHSRGASYNLLEAVTETSSEWWRGSASTFLLRELLENQEFREEFVNRFADLLNTAFLPERVIGVIDEMQAGLADEIVHHADRWGSPGNWSGHVNNMRNFANQRPAYVWGHLRGKFSLSQNALTLNVSDPDAGFVRVNSVDVDYGTPGVSASAYPWTGSYFQEVPIEVTAQARPGYRFSHWEELTDRTRRLRTVNIDLVENTTLTAVFVEAASPVALHYWHFNELTGGVVSEVPADHSITGTGLITHPGTGEGYMDDTDGTDLNARLGASAGQGLRVRNPSDSRTLQFNLPTTGYEQVRFSYAVRRTPNGARGQAIEYRTVSGQADWTPLQHDAINVTEDYRVLEFDFSGVHAANDNSDFAIRIRFTGVEASGTSGNNRFDNVVLEAVPMEGTVPPVASKLAIESAPAAVQVDRPTFPFVVEALLDNGAVDPTFEEEVTLSRTSGPGELSGTLSSPMEAGRAVFDDVRFGSPGVYTLTVTGGGLESEDTISVQAVLVREEIMPLFIQGDQDAGGDNFDRIPFAFRLRIEGLTPESTYRYGNRIVVPDDPLDQNGAGNAILITGENSDWIRNTDSPRFQPDDHGSRHLTFTADADGTYAGWFVTEPSGNARFTPGGTVFVRLLLNDGDDGQELHHYLTTELPVTVLPFGSGLEEGSGFMGETVSPSRNFVVFYDNEDGEGRPLAAVPVEITGSGTDERYATFYDQIVAVNERHWGIILPNALDQGIRRIEERGLRDGALLNVYRASEAVDGTVSPSHGLDAQSFAVDYLSSAMTYGDWRQMAFPDPADLADPGISGPAADPGRIGIANLLRYAFDLGFGTLSRAGLPRLEIGDDGEATLLFAYPGNRSDIAYVVHASSDQVDWSQSIFDSRVDVPDSIQNGTLRVNTGYTPGEDPHRSFRVKVLFPVQP